MNYNYNGLEIAVIGLAGRFPAAKDISEFWNNLINGKEGVEFVSPEELLANKKARNLSSNPRYVNGKGGVLANKFDFDAELFGYTPNEALILNPQTRIFHEIVWEALENCGYISRTDKNIIGLYAGSSFNFDWHKKVLLSGLSRQMGNYETDLLTDKDFMCSRIAYKFNLRGPVVAVQTACSTSLTAIHLGVRSVLLGECDMAIAGGVTVSTRDNYGYIYNEGMIMSEDGHCRAFDEKSSGTVNGEGGAVVILKKLSKAIEDNDPILALIKGSSINNDGDEKIGYTAPSVKGQSYVIKRTQAISKVKSSQISYVEAHGTGTKLGDPIEIEALNKAFDLKEKNICVIGSLKSSIGHMDAAAGVASVIKTILALANKIIPASINFETPNSKINFHEGPFYVVNKAMPWNSNGFPRRAAVNSLGIGGSNAHIILEEAPKLQQCDQIREYNTINISANSERSVIRYLDKLVKFLTENKDVNFSDLSYTLLTGRKQLKYKSAVVCKNSEEFQQIIWDKKYKVNIEKTNIKNRLVFIFSGQGNEYIGIGQSLYKYEPAIRKTMDSCFKIYHDLFDINLSEIVYPEHHSLIQVNVDNEPLPTDVAQPLLFIIEYAIAKLLIQIGIVPDAMIGHSLGEYVSACVSGVISLEDALKMLHFRGKYMVMSARGCMLGVGAGIDEIEGFLTNELSIASINAKNRIVISGSNDAVEKFKNCLIKRNIPWKIINDRYAFHSPMMKEAAYKYEKAIESIKYSEVGIPYISNITGDWITNTDIDTQYWSRHIVEAVSYEKGILRLLDDQNNMFIEIGPGKSLSSLVSQIKSKEQKIEVFQTLPSKEENISSDLFFLESLNRMWLKGITINWDNYFINERRNKICLPTYCFDHKEFRLEDRAFSLDFKADEAIGERIHIPVWAQSIIKPRKNILFEEFQWGIVVGEYGEIEKGIIRKLKESEASYFVINLNKKNSIEGAFDVEPDNYDDYSKFFKTLSFINSKTVKIIHLGALSKACSRGLENLKTTKDYCFYSYVYLAKAISQCNISNKFELIAVTSGVRKIYGNEIIVPEKAIVLGAAKIIPLEYQSINCRCIDINPSDFVDDLNGQISNLLCECIVRKKTPLVALRSNYIWYERFSNPEFKKSPSEEIKIKNGGTYLILGGFGGMGFTLAEHLVLNYNANLILVGRSFPEKDQWNDLIDNAEQSNRETLEKIKKIKEWQNKGSIVHVCKTDINDNLEMNKLYSRVLSKSKIDGVIHAAGVIDFGGIIQRRERKDFDKYMDSKIKGVLLIEELFKGKNLDFLLLFSSIGNLFYDRKFGQISYGAANEFLEAYAEMCKGKTSTFVATINWNDWLEVGMSVKALEIMMNKSRKEIDFRKHLSDSSTSLEGIEIFEYLLKSNYNRISISKLDLDKHVSNSYIFKEEENVKKESDERGTIKNVKKIDVKNIFCKYLGVDDIEEKEDFFTLGIDSLKLLTISTRIQEQLGVNVPLQVFYSTPTIQEIKEYVDKIIGSKECVEEITLCEKKEYYKLSAEQLRIYSLHYFADNKALYNQPLVFEVSNLDIDKIKLSLNELISVHESLRTVFINIKGETYQYVNDVKDVELEDLSDFKGSVSDCISRFIRPFDLEKSRCFRIAYKDLGNQKHLILMDLHHIISDGIGNENFINELFRLYNGEKSNIPYMQFRDYTEWQSKKTNSKYLEKAETFWLKELKEPLTELTLPYDYQRPSSQKYHGDSVNFKLSEEYSEKIKEFAKNESVTNYMLMLALLNVSLYKITEDEDVIIGNTVSGRTVPGVEDVIGMFVKTVIHRHKIDKSGKFVDFLKKVKTKTLDVLYYQAFPFDEIVRKVLRGRKSGRNPIFDVMYEYNTSINMDELIFDNLEFKRRSVKRKTTLFDLNFHVIETKKAFYFQIDYCTELFNRQTVEIITEKFVKITEQIIENKNIVLSSIDDCINEEKVLIESNSFDFDLNLI